MKKFFKIVWNNLKIIMGIALICATFYFGYNYLNSKFKTPDSDYGESFHSLPEDSLDVVVLGSSHAQYSFMPFFFYQDTGLNSYVLGSQFQPLKVSYEFLKECLKTQNPEVVILEVYTGTFYTDEETDDSNDSRYIVAQYQMTGEERENVLDYMVNKEKAVEYRNSYLTNHNNWRTVEDFKEMFTKPETDESYISGEMGFVANFNIWLPVANYWFSPRYDDDLQGVELMDEDVEALNNIYNLCQEKGMDLLLYMMPMDNVDETNQTLRHKIWDWADEKGVNYIDMLYGDYELDLRSVIHHDGFHAYINGAAFVTDYLAEYVKNNYSIESHTDSELLAEIYNRSARDYAPEVLGREINPAKFMPRFINFPGTVVVKYTGNTLTEDFKTYLDKMGIGDLIYNNHSFYGVLVNGQLVDYSTDGLTYEDNGHTIELNSNGIYRDGELIDDNSYLTLTLFKNDYADYSSKHITCDGGSAWEYGWNYRYEPIN